MQKSTLSRLLGFTDGANNGRVDRHYLIRAMVACALLMAMAIVFKTVIQFSMPMFGVKSQEINFSYAVIMFAGFVFGPIWGGLVGAGADLIACVISAEGAPIIGITVTNFFIGFLPGIYAYFAGRNAYRLWALAPFCLILTSLASLHNSWWIKLMYLPDKGYFVYALPRLAFNAIIIFPLNTLIIYVLMNKAVPILRKSGLLPKERIDDKQ